MNEISPQNNFFNPYEKVDMGKNHLPHWQQGEVCIFVTWRLADSLPTESLKQWRYEKESWLVLHPEPWDKETEEEYHEKFSRQIDDWLDQGSGSCVLRDPKVANVVADAIEYFDGKRYSLAAYVIMPNHVHILFQPLNNHQLSDIVKSLKSFTSRKINKFLDKSGPLWQKDYWDRLIRIEKHFNETVEYIRKNPVRAKLKDGQYLLRINS